MTSSQSVQGSRKFRWLPSLAGGMAAIGVAALLGTLVTNGSLWFYVAQGFSIQEAYGRIGSFGLNTPAELLSMAVLLLAGFSGGYVSALYGGGRHVLQAFVAGIVGTTFFVAMSIGPSNSAPPSWYATLYIALLLTSSLAGGYWYARNAAAPTNKTL